MPDRPPYRDPALPVDARVADLLARMTLEEKLRQLTMGMVRGDLFKEGVFQPDGAKRRFGDLGIGAVLDMRKDPATSARDVNLIQDYLLRETRLGVPALVVGETLHGLMSPGATVFPQNIALGSSWDTDLVAEVATVAAREARAIGIAQGLAPDLDLARDPRWGRVEETYGEDPYLCERLGVAYVAALQGGGKARIDRDHLAATLKHFAAHGTPEGGINIAPVSAGERQLRELYLPPFEAAITEAGALSVMPGYSEFDGVPLHASRLLLDRILRQEWGFLGYVISDFGALDMVVDLHKTAATLDEAGLRCLEAGTDMEAPMEKAFAHLGDAVRSGRVSEAVIDRAAARILRVKFILGLFEHPYAAEPARAAAVVNCSEHRELALRAAHESIVLLKNDGPLLPLDEKTLRSIAVIGPNAAAAQLGDYAFVKDADVTPLRGLQDRLPAGVEVRYARGCGLWERSTDGFAEAVDAAKAADVAVLFVGGSSMSKGGIGWGSQAKAVATCGEGYDRSSLDLPGVQQQLVEAVVATGTPTVVALINGRPLSIGWIAQHVPAIVEAWYPGEEGGHAVADVLLGRVNPSGKLNISFPRSVGHVPAFYNHKPSARGYYRQPGTPDDPGRDYVFSHPSPLFPFGHGLSYTRFAYDNLRVEPTTIGPAGKATVRVDVRNVGDRAGKEVVQLYVTDVVSSVTTPVRALKGFAKIDLRPGESKTVTFELGPKHLSLFDESMQRVVEPGTFEVAVADLKATFEVR